MMSFDSEEEYHMNPTTPMQTEVYVSDTRAIAFFDNDNPNTNSSLKFHVKYCNGQKKYDVVLQ